jgi:hypothetical protein
MNYFLYINLYNYTLIFYYHHDKADDLIRKFFSLGEQKEIYKYNLNKLIRILIGRDFGQK